MNLLTGTNRPIVTISLVTYNGTRWLDRCLRSLRSQTFENFEVLVVDNASSDGTVEFLREEVSRDTRMRLFESSQNLGYAAANNRNIASARGEFVLLLNQDVDLDDRFLAAALAAFDNRPKIAGDSLEPHDSALDQANIVAQPTSDAVKERVTDGLPA